MSDLMAQDLATRRKARRVLLTGIAAAVVVVTLAVGVGVWIGSSRSGQQTSRPAPSSASSGGVEHGDDGVADLDELDHLIPQAELDALQWHVLYWLEAPSSPQHGPQDMSRGRTRGFTRTPIGALIAAASIGVCADQSAGSDVFEPTIREQFVGGDKNKLLSTTLKEYEQARQAQGVEKGEPLPSEVSSLSGFRFGAYSRSNATVYLLMPIPPDPLRPDLPPYQSFKLDLRWKSGDWQIVAPKEGDWIHSVSLVSSPDSFTMFGPR